jgi:hypothetical protein
LAPLIKGISPFLYGLTERHQPDRRGDAVIKVPFSARIVATQFYFEIQLIALSLEDACHRHTDAGDIFNGFLSNGV